MAKDGVRVAQNQYYKYGRFPEHGPYLGVYAIADKEPLCGGGGGLLCVGDSFGVVDNNRVKRDRSCDYDSTSWY